MRALIALTLLLVGCGSSSPSRPTPLPAPTPAPAPARFTFAGRVTITQSGAPVPGAMIAFDTVAPVQADSAGNFSVDATSPTLHAVISAPGYLTRDTRLGSGHPLTVDLISAVTPFSTIFYGQLARNTLEASAPDILRVLPASPSIYIQTAGISSADVNTIAQTARAIIPAMTGGRLSVLSVETGDALRPLAPGWIVVEIGGTILSGDLCGQAEIGASLGHVWLRPTATCLDPGVIRHEFGHALGFFHIDVPSALMNAKYAGGKDVSDAERYHAGVAYHRSAGNRDPDSDAVTSTPLSVRSGIVVID